MRQKVLFIICTAIICGILTAGLWPFHAPKNDVSWLNDQNGLLFGEYGSVLSSKEFTLDGIPTGASVEIWMQPRESFDSNDLISFYTPGNPLQLRIDQSGDDLFVTRDIPEQQHQFRTEHIALDHIFRKGVKALITVTSGDQGTKVYIDGVLAKTSSQFVFTTRNLTGTLIIGNSPVRNYSWAGQLQGLAFYGKELTAAEVIAHYNAWTRNEVSRDLANENTLALYPFDEHSGSVVHNQIRSEPDLYIPPHYFVLHQVLLMPLWEEFHWTWSYVQDLLINVGGFIPLGFFFCAYFSGNQRMNRPILSAIVVGGITSLIIEVTQAFLPTRDSGMTDLITNTSGTALGAILYRLEFTRILLAKFEVFVQSFKKSVHVSVLERR
jgi:hypothetical protein